jgi:hypothetical protein
MSVSWSVVSTTAIVAAAPLGCVVAASALLCRAMNGAWLLACATLVLDVCFAPPTARAQEASIRLLMEPSEGERLQAGLQQQLAGKPLQIEQGEPPAGSTPQQRVDAALDALQGQSAVTAMWFELSASGERSLVALTPCGLPRSAPLDAREI